LTKQRQARSKFQVIEGAQNFQSRLPFMVQHKPHSLTQAGSKNRVS
jgi:hypothetical protein